MSTTRQSDNRSVRVPLAHRERIDWHDHAEHQLIYPRRGVLHVSTPLGTWVVPSHRAVWIPARVPHSHEAHGPTDMRGLRFHPEEPPRTAAGRAFVEAAGAATGQVNPLRLDRPTVLAVTPLLREVIAALTDDEELTAGQRRNLERVVLDQLRRVEALRLWLPSPSDPRLRDIARILHADPADGRTLAEFGAAVGAGERTLSRRFREETGMTFPQWRAQLRLHHSLTLLATGASVTAVAAACGYSGPSAFIHAFRSGFGGTPGEYALTRLGERPTTWAGGDLRGRW